MQRFCALLDLEAFRFLVTGSSAAALFYVMTYALIRLGAPAFAGTILAYGVAFVASYLTQQAWTFRNQRNHGEAFPRYLAAQLFCAAISASVARGLAAEGIAPALTALASTLIASALSFVLSRFWVFGSR